MCVDLFIVGSYDAMVFVILLVDKLLVKENIKASFAWFYFPLHCLKQTNERELKPVKKKKL